MEALLLRFTRCERIPLNLRRMLGNRLLPRSSREFELPMGERAFRGRLDNYIDRVVYLTGRYFEYTYLRLFRKLSPPTGCALDIGANVGNHSLALSAHFESVHAFEPYPPVYAELVERTASVPNIVCHRTALGARPGSLAFAPPEGENLGTGRIATGGKLEVPVSTGDEIVAERIEEPVSFIKVDTEGHELEVLDGLRKTLAAHQPVVAFEIPKRTDLSKAEGFAAVMERLPDGYRFYGLPSQSTFPVQRAVARPEPYEARGFRSRWKMGLALPAGA